MEILCYYQYDKRTELACMNEVKTQEILDTKKEYEEPLVDFIDFALSDYIYAGFDSSK